MKRNKHIMTLTFALTLSHTAWAGKNCEKLAPKPEMFFKASKAALEVSQQLSKQNTQVALLARAGSNLSQYGIRYSHVAFVVKNYTGRPGKWTVVHLLNECKTSHSSLYKQGLINFFMDDLYKMDYQITIPNEAMQASLYQALMPKSIEKLHGKQYSMIAYPFSTKYQNSNQWVLEKIAYAVNPKAVNSRFAAQDYLRATGYKPSIIFVSPLEKLGASFSSNVQFDDHPRRENQLNKYSIVTVASVVNYLKQQARLSA